MRLFQIALIGILSIGLMSGCAKQNPVRPGGPGGPGVGGQPTTGGQRPPVTAPQTQGQPPQTMPYADDDQYYSDELVQNVYNWCMSVVESEEELDQCVEWVFNGA